MPQRTVQRLATAVIAELDPTYTLMYVQQGDQLSDTQVNALVQGDGETLWDELAEFESQNRDDATDEILKRVSADVIRGWEHDDDRDYEELHEKFLDSEDAFKIRDLIAERDDSTWMRDLADQTPAVLLRITAIEEDDAFAFVPVTPQQVLTTIGLTADAHNVGEVAVVLENASPEFSVLMGYWIVGADVRGLVDLPGDTQEVDIINPYLYLGNPVMGHGYVSDAPLHGTVRIKGADLRTDEQAYGYSINTIYGAINASSFTAQVISVPPKDPRTQ